MQIWRVTKPKVCKSKHGYQLKLVKIRGKKEWLLGGEILNRFDLLATASRCANENEAWEILKTASILFHPLDDPAFNELYGCVATEITRNFQKDEFYYQRLFKEKYSKLREGTVTDHPANGKDIPDAWVLKGDSLIPVEVKFGNFDKKALKQLRRYMNAYSSKSGIAVARQATVTLPHNIDFVSLKELEDV